MAYYQELFYAYHLLEDDEVKPVYLTPSLLTGPGIPRHAQQINMFNHHRLTNTVAIHQPTGRVITGGRGMVKVWDISQPGRKGPITEQDYCGPPGDSETINLRILDNGQSMLTSGTTLYLWDLSPLLQLKAVLPAPIKMGLGLATSPDEKLAFVTCTDGEVFVMDIHNKCVIMRFQGHNVSASSVDTFPDGNSFCTGSFDNQVRLWDFRQCRCVREYQFPAPVHSLRYRPIENWLAVGLGNGSIEILNLSGGEKYRLILHDGFVLSIRFISNGKCFLSTSSDRQVISWRAPYGACLFKTSEESTVMCCDISHDDNFFVVGSKEKAMMYEILY